MQATRFEYRFGVWIQALIYLLGFFAPWLYWSAFSDALALSDRSTWLVLAALLARQGWLAFGAAAMVLLAVALIFTGLGAWLRTWGAAYADPSPEAPNAVHPADPGGDRMPAGGPFRRTRNPLYMGALLHTIGVAILMPPSGAIFAIVLLWVFQARLALAKERLLAARLGQPYLDYKARVPRFLPTPTPQVAKAGAVPHWGHAVLGQIYFIGVFVTLAIFGWGFNAQPLHRGILISLGVALIARAFLPRAAAEPIEAS